MHGGCHCRTSRCSDKHSGEPRDECIPRARDTFLPSTNLRPSSGFCSEIVQIHAANVLGCGCRLCVRDGTGLPSLMHLARILQMDWRKPVWKVSNRPAKGSSDRWLLPDNAPKARFLLGQRQLCNPAKTIYGTRDGLI